MKIVWKSFLSEEQNRGKIEPIWEVDCQSPAMQNLKMSLGI